VQTEADLASSQDSEDSEEAGESDVELAYEEETLPSLEPVIMTEPVIGTPIEQIAEQYTNPVGEHLETES